ncbi:MULTISPECIES: transposase DNA-binding-containing protein [Planktothricoides]|uniref:Transposase DNA-binding-containing protein n=2 Tax=Planktothricoides raciborskii TaxID=132608 RepID=A0AAU8JE63_9CYAN|nr:MULTISPECIES: transposase DNA-binding-containing protein [Planktothricoides]MBD2544125.1 hypothetical protein [Planktothricoides raciborskii FACHB-1370]MBD2582610.1 hypothetical protein [Planktothricoides raciborskii FACHB-1261]
MNSWVAEELKHTELGDARRHRRLVLLPLDCVIYTQRLFPLKLRQL